MAEYHIIRAIVPFELRTLDIVTMPVLVELLYDTRDPYAVAFTPLQVTGPVRWLFGRELLSVGMVAEVGDGDVRIAPLPEVAAMVVKLGSPENAAVLQTATAEIALFLDGTTELVPLGEESAWFDFDRELAKLV